MSTANVRNVEFIPGKLIVDPTDLTTTDPYGGTEIGLTRMHIWDPHVRTAKYTGMEHGGIVTEVSYQGEQPVFLAILREFDDDALNKIFANTVWGPTTGKRGIRYYPGDSDYSQPGYLLSNKALKLLFVPKSPNQHRAILLWNAIAAPQEDFRISLKASEEVGLPIAFYAGVDSSKRCYDWMMLADMPAVS